MSKGAATLLPGNAASCVSLSGTLQPTDVMWSEIFPLLSREKGLALLLLLCAAAVRLSAAAAAPTTAVWYANRRILLIPTISWPTPGASCSSGRCLFQAPLPSTAQFATCSTSQNQTEGCIRRVMAASRSFFCCCCCWRGVRYHEFCCVHSPLSLTIHGETATAVQPSVGRQNRVHWKRPTEPKAIAVDWVDSASPSAGRFWKSLSKELSRYTTEIKGDPYDISSTWLPPRPPNTVCIQFAHMLQGIHPLVPRTTRYSSIWPKY
jgi:hypothetical protein